MKRFSGNFNDNQNLHLTINTRNPDKIDLNTIADTLNKFCSSVNLKRFDETDEMLEVSFIVEIDEYKNLKEIGDNLRNLNESLTVTFLDMKGI